MEEKETPVAFLDLWTSMKLSQKEVDTLVDILQTISTHYDGLKLWDGNKQYAILKLDEFLSSVRSESTRFFEEDFSTLPNSQYEFFKDIIVHWIRNVITDRDRFKRIYEEVGRVRIGMTINEALTVAPSEPPQQIWFFKDFFGDKEGRSIILSYPGRWSRFDLASPPEIAISLETGLVQWQGWSEDE
jgi:hypothetical protein